MLSKIPGLVMHLPLNESSGSTAFDNTRYSNDGSLGGGDAAKMPVWTEHGLRFDGVNDYVDCGNDASLNITEAITILAWIYPICDKSYARIVDKTYTTGYAVWAHNILSNGKIAFYSNNVGIGQSSDAVFGSSEWHYLTVTYDRVNIKFYRNGVYAGGGAETSAIGLNSDNLGIGAKTVITNLFDGSIDDVRIYNRALSAAEITDLYNSRRHLYL